MTPDDAFEGEMTQQAKAFFDAVARELPESPSAQLEASIVRQAAAAAVAAPVERGAHEPVRARFGARTRVPLRIALVAGALMAGTTGLAVAGVELPGPIDSGLRKVGIHMPNQHDPAPASTQPAGKRHSATPGRAATESPGSATSAEQKSRAKHIKRRGKRNHGAAAGDHPSSQSQKPHPAHPAHPTQPEASSPQAPLPPPPPSPPAKPVHPVQPAVPVHPVTPSKGKQ
jgi:hypothetical protein